MKNKLIVVINRFTKVPRGVSPYIGKVLDSLLIKSLIIGALICLMGPMLSIVYGQSPQIVPASPEAAALAKMVNYPVNLNTGIPDISIPLYQVESGGMVLPITLQYHAGGFKINERSTSVGLGWSLSSDIQITRSINGIDDFMTSPNTGYVANTKMKAHYPDGGQSYPLYDNDYFSGSNAYDIAAGKVDGMPDKFNYKLLNKSGSFYFQKDVWGTGYSIVPVPFDNLKITYSDGVFTILDTDGTKYSFGGLGAKEQQGAIITAWKCSRIENAFNTESIFFTYQSKSDVQFFSRSERIEYYYNEYPCNLSNYVTSDELGSGTSTFEEIISQYPFYHLSSPKYTEHFAYKPQAIFHLPYLDEQNQVIDKTYTDNSSNFPYVSTTTALALSEISFRGGKVVFSGTDELNSISIKDVNGGEIKSFSFFQSYTEPLILNNAKGLLNGDSFKGTLYLDSIQVKSNGIVFERYGLQYKQKFCFGNHLMGKDAWGNPNDYTTDFSGWVGNVPITVPHQQIKQRFVKDAMLFVGCPSVDDVTFDIGNSNNAEAPSREAAQLGILKRIIYPSGGFAEFDFEANMYKNETSDPFVYVVRMGAGLRIRSINYYDGKSSLPVSQKYYKYGDLEDGIGLLINAPNKNFEESRYEYDANSYSQYIAYMKALGDNCYTRDCLSLITTEKKTTYLPASSLSYTYPNGAPIYYTKVTEYNSDLGVNTGKKVYGFYNLNEFGVFDPRSKIPETNIDFLHADWLLGKQHFLKEYKYINGEYSLVHSKEFEYTKYSKAEQVKVVYSFFNVLYRVEGSFQSSDPKELYNSNYGSPVGNEYSAGDYGIEVGKLLLTAEKEKWVKNADTISQETNYTYDMAQQVSSIGTTGSNGHSITKSFKYPYNFSESVYSQMAAKNMISPVVEETVYNNRLGKEISHSKTNYGVININSVPKFIAPVSVQKSVGGASLETQMTYEQYDDFANILQITGKDQVPYAYLWGYNSKYLVAELKGITYNGAVSTIPQGQLQSTTDDVQLRTLLNNVRLAQPQAFVTTFTHKQLVGVSSQTTPAGKTSYYEYDPFGRLSVIRDQNNYIVKKHDYRMLNITSAPAGNGLYTNIPQMETFYKVYPDQWIKPYNYTVEGGTGLGFTAEAAAWGARLRLTEGGPINDGIADSVASTNLSSITLYGYYQYEAPVPDLMYLDLIKDGSVVASKGFSASFHDPYADFYAEPGEYQLSLRHQENYQGSALMFYLNTDQTGFFIKPGDKVTLLPGVSYSLTAMNWWY